jgi:transposase
MKARMSPLPDVADRLGVSRRTVKSWIRQEGYNLPGSETKGRHTILVPEWLEQRIVEKRTPRIPRRA